MCVTYGWKRPGSKREYGADSQNGVASTSISFISLLGGTGNPRAILIDLRPIWIVWTTTETAFASSDPGSDNSGRTSLHSSLYSTGVADWRWLWFRSKAKYRNFRNSGISWVKDWKHFRPA